MVRVLMRIEVPHDPEKLPLKRSFSTSNARAANNYFQAAMTTKRPRGGPKVRFSYDVKENILTIEGRNGIAIDTIEGILRNAGLITRRIK